MSFAQWVADFRWAMNVKRARAWRRNLSFSGREAFDLALRPPLKNEPGLVVMYPDAFYRITVEDLLRAMRAGARKHLDDALAPGERSRPAEKPGRDQQE